MTLNIAAFCVVLAACVAPLTAYYPYTSYFNQDPRAFSTGFGQQQQLVGLPAAYLAAQQQQQLLRAQMLGQQGYQGYGGFDPSIGWQQQQQQQLLRQQLQQQQQYNPYYAQQYWGYGNAYGSGGYGGYGNLGQAGVHYHPGYMHSGPFATRDLSKANSDEKA